MENFEQAKCTAVPKVGVAPQVENTPQEGRRARFAKDVGITLGAKFCNYGVALISSIMLARMLGPDGRGLLAVVSLLPGLVVAFGNLGIDASAVYLVAQKKWPLKILSGNILSLTLLLSLICVACGFGTVALFSHALFPGVSARYLFLSLALVPLGLLLSNVSSIFNGLARYRELNIFAVLQTVAFPVLFGALTWFGRLGLGGAILALILSVALANVAAISRLWRILGTPTLALSLGCLNDILRYGVVSHIGSVVQFLNYRVDVLLLNGFLNPKAVGFYTLAVSLAEILWSLSYAAGTVLFPLIASPIDSAQRNAATRTVARFVFLATSLGALLLFFLGRIAIVTLYSNRFLPAIHPLQAILPGVVALSAARVLANDLAGRGKVKVNSAIAFVTMMANVSLNFVLIPRFGIVGAAWSSTITYCLTMIATVALYCKYSGEAWSRLFLPEREDLATYAVAFAHIRKLLART